MGIRSSGWSTASAEGARRLGHRPDRLFGLHDPRRFRARRPTFSKIAFTDPTLLMVGPATSGRNEAGRRARHAARALAGSCQPDDTGRTSLGEALTMKSVRALGSALAIAGGAIVLPTTAAHASTSMTATFVYNGTDGSDGTPQTWTVPPGVSRATFHLVGAAGGAFESTGGEGGTLEATIPVTPGDVFTIVVGGQGG